MRGAAGGVVEEGSVVHALRGLMFTIGRGDSFLFRPGSIVSGQK
jgi:AraC-like protein